MSQQIKVTREFDATGATLLGIGGYPYLSGGKILFVDYLRGVDGNEGTNPNYPKKTIANAFDNLTYSQSTAWKNDYIFVIASKDQDDAATITPSSSTASAHWHLIGLTNANPTFGVVLRMDSDNTTAACMSLWETGFESEVAGISFGGGEDGGGGIDVAQTHGLWIHHCYFGHSFCGDTPDFGIYATKMANAENMLIEDNTFWGDQNDSRGKLAVDGIRLQGPTPEINLMIKNNVFMGITGIAINIDSTGGVITGNQISCDANTAGAAITLGTYSYGCWLNNNYANHGDTNAMVASPWVDNSAGGTDANTWCLNYKGGAASYPA